MEDGFIPRDVRLQITNRCNLKCNHCFANGGTSFSNELSTTEVISLLYELKNAGTEMVTLTGGEPLVVKDKALAAIREGVRLGFKMHLNTNATLMDEATGKAFGDAGVHTIMVGMDGRPERHEALRGAKGCFEKTIKGIKNAQAECIAIRFTMTKDNIGDLPFMIRLSEELGVDKFVIKPFIPSGRGEEHVELMPSSEEQRNAMKMLLELEKDLSLKIEYLMPCFEFLLVDKKPEPCNCGSELMFISADGSIKPCGYFNAVLGNVRTDDIKSLWQNHPLLREIRTVEPEGCQGCIHVHSCRGGCIAHTYNRFGKVGRKDVYCFR